MVTRMAGQGDQQLFCSRTGTDARFRNRTCAKGHLTQASTHAYCGADDTGRIVVRGRRAKADRKRNGDMEREIARIESLLDRYGVIAAPLIDKDRIAGGFSRLYPVLKRMEEHGMLVRGLFVDGFGAAQFAGHDTVDALRSENQWHSQSCVALEVTDPASLTGAAIAWPELEPTKTEKADGSRGAKPARRTGSIVVFKEGEPVLFAVPKSHRIMAFTDAEGTLRQACSELVYALQRQSGGSISFNEMNGISLKQRNKYMRLLHAAGMKLYR